MKLSRNRLESTVPSCNSWQLPPRQLSSFTLAVSKSAIPCTKLLEPPLEVVNSLRSGYTPSGSRQMCQTPLQTAVTSINRYLTRDQKVKLLM